MINTILHKLNNKTISMVILGLLLLVAALPIPSILSFVSIRNEVKATDRECSRLEEKSIDLREREKELSLDLSEVDGELSNRFGGLDSALLLRNIILRLAKVNQIKTSSCLFRDATLLNESMTPRSGIGKSVYSVIIDIRGTAFLEDLFVFIYILEEMGISLQMKEFSVVDLANRSGDYSFSISFTGFYVVDDGQEEPGD